MSEDVPRDAREHAMTTGDGSRPPLPAMPAPRRGLQRKMAVTTRAPFLPGHHGHARHALKPHGDQ